MRYLIERARELGLNEVVDRTLEFSSIHGVVLTIHDWWLSLSMPRSFGKSYDLFPDFNAPFPRQVIPRSNSVMTSIDLSFRPPEWIRVFGQRSPIVVTLHMKPGMPFVDPEEILSGNPSLFIRQESRSIPRMVANPQGRFTTMQGGISISENGSNVAGTLGGILKDAATGVRYAISCGHVIPSNNVPVIQPALIDHGSNRIIGNCIYSKDALPNLGNVCNPRNLTSNLNDMDVALIELNQIGSQFSINNIGAVDGITPANLINKGMGIEYTGRTSSHKPNLMVNSIGVVQQVTALNGSICCYKDLIQFQDPSISSLVNNSPAQGGDSGAWAITQRNGNNEWCAMIVAEDRQSAYGIMSEDIITHLNCEKNLNLVCK
jgi:hypothetical protein